MSVAQALYRSMWRWVRSPAVRCNPHFALPLDKLPASVVRAAERLESPRGAAGSRELLRLAWREAASTSGEAATAAELDDAFRVLRVLGELGEELEALQKKRASNAWRVGVEMRIGEVVRHSQYGYRGVVLGWDRKAEVDVSGWDGLRKSSRGGDQPFYRLLPDYTDCAELLGGPREVKYVAQENLERLPPRYTRVHHPALLSPGASPPVRRDDHGEEPCLTLAGASLQAPFSATTRRRPPLSRPTSSPTSTPARGPPARGPPGRSPPSQMGPWEPMGRRRARRARRWRRRHEPSRRR